MLNETVQSEVDEMGSGMDETMMFRTLMSVAEPPPMPVTRSVSYASLVTKSPGRSAATAAPKSNWSVRPRRLLMNLSNAGQAQPITIRNDFPTVQTFQVQVNRRGFVECRPEVGLLEPGEEHQLMVRMANGLRTAVGGGGGGVDEILLTVYIESDKIDVLIIIDRRVR